MTNSLRSEAEFFISKFYLSRNLIEVQGLTDIEVIRIGKLHSEVDDLIKKSNSMTVFNEDQLRDVAHKIFDLECALQRAWRFDENPHKHTHSFRFEVCTCPENLFSGGMRMPEGYGDKIKINRSCPIHKHLRNKFSR